MGHFMDKKTVVIVDHPNYSQSNVNRRFVDEMRKYPDEILIHNLQSCYPTGVLDASKEHCVLENNGTIVLQFPFYWFNCPPKMKEWFDKVLTSNWAFKDAYHLENKKIGLCVSCGSEEAAYTASGRHHRKVEDYLANILHAFEMCRVDYIGSFITYGINDTEIVTADVIGQRAREYIEWLKSIAS